MAEHLSRRPPPVGARPAPMVLALRRARAAGRRGEVPVGAVVTDLAGRRLAAASNRCERACDATAHAEILALGAAGRVVGGWRLAGCTLWVTLEPCRMCAAALALARVSRVVYGAADPQLGGLGGSRAPASWATGRVEVVGGVMAEEAAALLGGFFAALRSPAKRGKAGPQRST